MCPPDSAFQGPPRACEFGGTDAEPPAQRQVSSWHLGFGEAPMPQRHFFVLPTEVKIVRSIPHENLQIERPSRANLPGAIRGRRDPTAAPLLSSALGTPR